MACSSNNSNNCASYTLNTTYTPCDTCTSVDSQCIIYTGPTLACLNIETNTKLEDIIKEIDTVLCMNVENGFGSYDFHCLADTYTINTEAQFVSAITEYVCDFKADFDTLVSTTIPGYISDLQDQIDLINNPELTPTCDILDYTDESTLTEVLTSQSLAICTIADNLNISTVEWDMCMEVSTIPGTVAQGFTMVLTQLCNLKSTIDEITVTLPTFNNEGTCLAGATDNDTLDDTVQMIRTRLCQTPVFDINALDVICFDLEEAGDLQGLVQQFITVIEGQLSYTPTEWDSGHFTVEMSDPENACGGVRVALNEEALAGLSDKLVSVDGSDTAGYLSAKIVAGDNISITIDTEDGVLIINGEASGENADEKVKSWSGDSTAGFLDSKLKDGVSDDGLITTTVEVDEGDDMIKITAEIDVEALITAIITLANSNPTVKTALCELFASCPDTCSAPTNTSITFS